MPVDDPTAMAVDKPAEDAEARPDAAGDAALGGEAAGTNGQESGGEEEDEAAIKLAEGATLDKIKDVVKEDTACMICFQVLGKTRTVAACLHRFCFDCIECALRVNAKECPLCKAHIPSRRSLREDKHFDGLIEAIYGDPHALRESESRRAEEWWHSNKGSFKHIGEAYTKQKEATKWRRASTKPKKPKKAPAPKVPKPKPVVGTKRGRGRPPKSAAATTEMRSQYSKPGEVVAYYSQLAQEERARSTRLAQEAALAGVGGARKPQQGAEENVLVRCYAHPDLQTAFPLQRPSLICKGWITVGNLRELIESKRPKGLSESKVELLLLPSHDPSQWRDGQRVQEDTTLEELMQRQTEDQARYPHDGVHGFPFLYALEAS